MRSAISARASQRNAAVELVSSSSTRPRTRIATLRSIRRGHLRSAERRSSFFAAAREVVQRQPEALGNVMSLGELLIVGPGVLGSFVAKLWVERGGTVIGRTRTIDNHPRLTSLGVVPETYENKNASKFAHVVYCAPPSGSQDYPGSVAESISCWDGTGSFVFTSSTGVFSQSEEITEDTPTLPMGMNPRIDRLLKAEQAVLEAGGNVVRLAGLYHSLRGPHSAVIARGVSSRAPNYPLCLIHYQDAAALVFQVLLQGKKFRKEIFLGADGQTISFQNLVDEAVSSGLFDGQVTFEMEPLEPASVRKMNNAKTIERLQGTWLPEYTFASLMRSGGNDWYKTSGLW